MGLLGALLGGTVGFMLGGPLGAMIGGGLGAQVGLADRAAAYRSRAGGYSAQELQSTFLIAVISLAAKTAKADGRVTAKEVRTFDAFLQRLGMGVDERRMAGRIFNRARDSAIPASEFAHQVRQIMASQPDRIRDIVTLLLEIAHADGHLHPAEETLIQGLALEMGLSSRDYTSCKALFGAATGLANSSAYEVLGLTSEATDDEVKQAYRQIARDYHPDTIESKGLPADFTRFATEKMQTANDAYARIKSERNL